MVDDRWSRLEAIFAEAHTLPASERAAFLDEACGNDRELRRRVETLLEHSDGSGTFVKEAIREAEPAAASPSADAGLSPTASLVGQSLGRFRVLERLGAGGMGEVYLAEDTRLGRRVALKVLPATLMRDPELLSRFRREAKLLASLSHAHIAAVHEVDEEEGRPFLVMELALGETLAERVSRGAIPVAEALEIALQVASALEAAHEVGIVHRDLKPANVMVEGEKDLGEIRVKVLDFGLGKALMPQAESSPQELADSPTLTERATRAGMLLGTAAYMSPEQARGRPVDTRADNWAFGVVLWEMLVGRRLFPGESVADVLAEVIKSEPDLGALPPEALPGVVRLIGHCLRKEPKSRLRDIGDARIVLEDAIAGRDPVASAAAGAVSERAKTLWPRWTIGLAVVGLLAALGVGYLLGGRSDGPASSPRVARLAIPLEGSLRASELAITPDGETVLFSAYDASPEAIDRRTRLYVRQLDRYTADPIAGSEGVVTWTLSPDGGSLAFIAPVSQGSPRRRLYRAPVDGSAPPLRVAELAEDLHLRDLAWAPGDVLFAIQRQTTILRRFPVDGPPLEPLEIVADRPISLPNWIQITDVLPSGAFALAHFNAKRERGEDYAVGLIDLQSGDLHTLVDYGLYPQLLASGDLLFSRGETLLAAPFDLDRRVVSGTAQTVADDLWVGFTPDGWVAGGQFEVAVDGTLVYLAGSDRTAERRLVVIEENGAVSDWSDDRLTFTHVEVSNDGRRVAVSASTTRDQDVQVLLSELDRPRLRSFALSSGKHCEVGAWSPDGRLLAYSCYDETSFELFLRAVDESRGASRMAAPVMTTSPERAAWTLGFNADGSQMVVGEWSPEEQRSQYLVVPSAADSRSADSAQRIWEEHSEILGADLSPDSRWLAYWSGPDGEVYVCSVGADWSLGRPLLVTRAGAFDARWGKPRNGDLQLFFEGPDRRLHSVRLIESPEPRLSEPRDTGIDAMTLRYWDTLPGGGFLASQRGEGELGSERIHLVAGWAVELEQRMGRE